jgi:hypothetical protein
MALVTVIAGEIRKRAIELTRAASGSELNTWAIAYRQGFFEAIRLMFPSETVRILIAECDSAIEQEGEER